MLLGPQRRTPIVGEAMARMAIDSRPEAKIAAITAGWQEREAEDQDLCAAFGNRTINLMLHARGDAVFHDDADLFTAHRAKQDRLRHLQELYRMRLASALKPVRRLQHMAAPLDLIEAELEEALQAVRLLDAHHVVKVQHIENQFSRRFRPLERPVVRKHLQEIDEILKRCCALAIAGGHVAVIYNRLRFFDFAARLDAVPELPVVAWSAGAMAVSERIVLFHDSPPQGRGNAEVLGPGLGLFHGVVVLPHASQRLLLHDVGRISVFARRFAPAVCYALDDRCWLHFHGSGHITGPNTAQLSSDGQLVAASPERAP